MAMSSYWTGQKYFPIPYPMGRMLIYIGLALSLYALSTVFANLSLWLRLLINTGLLGIFTLAIYRLDGAALRAMIGRK